MRVFLRLVGLSLCVLLSLFAPRASGQTPTAPPPHNQYQYPLMVFEGPQSIIVTAYPKPTTYDLDVFVRAWDTRRDTAATDAEKAKYLTTKIEVKAGSKLIASCVNAVQCQFVWPYVGMAANTSINVKMTLAGGATFTVYGNLRRPNKTIAAQVPTPPTQTSRYLLDDAGGRLTTALGDPLTY